MKQRKLAVFGATGKVGSALLSSSSANWLPVAVPRDLTASCNDASLSTWIADNSIDAAVNCVAKLGVASCEADPREAWQTNVSIAACIARACAKGSVPLIHLSTESVFSGMGPQFRTEFDRPNPSTVYGASKLASEAVVLSQHQQAICIRLGIVVGGSGRGQFFERALDQLFRGAVLTIRDDVETAITSCANFTKWLWSSLDSPFIGAERILHWTNEGSASLYTLVEFAASQFGLGSNVKRAYGSNLLLDPERWDGINTALRSQILPRNPPWEVAIEEETRRFAHAVAGDSIRCREF